ncbi:MAG: diguanylate cyclase [Elstera sp.]
MLDPASLIFLHTTMMWSCAAAFLLIRYVKPDWVFPTQWGIAFAVMPLVMLLEGYAERVDSDSWRIAGFAIGFLGPALMTDGLRAFLGRPPHPRLWLGAFTVFLGGILAFTGLFPSLQGRLMVFQLMTVGICFYLLHVIRHLSAEDHALGRSFLRVFASVPLLAFVAQSFLAVVGDNTASPAESVTLVLLAATAVGILAAIGCIILVAERFAAHVGHQAGIDLLTGLPTRRNFSQKVDHALRQFNAGGPEVSVILFDIDHFKAINDTHGHDMGDRALQAVAECASRHARPTDFIARLGGDEFAILLPDTRLDEATHIARRVLEALRSLRLEHEGALVRVSGSFGVAHLERDDETVHSVMKRADVALYAVKRRGRNDVEPQAFSSISA